MAEMRPIPGYPGYFARDDGKIISVKQGKDVVLKPLDNINGYYYVNIYNSGVPKRCTIHKLVAAAFLGPTDSLTVNHKDGIKHNNSVENLEYITLKENLAHAYKTGLSKPHKWTREVRLIDTLSGEVSVFISIKKCAEKIGKSACTVSNAIRQRGLCGGRYFIEYTGYAFLVDRDYTVFDRRKIEEI